MSHTTTVKSVAIRDIEALRMAIAELAEKRGIKATLEEGDNINPRMYYREQERELKGKTPYVLRLPDASYDVGFQKMEDGTYAPVTDFYGGSVEKHLHAECGCKPSGMTEEDRVRYALGGLMQGYAKHASINQAVAQGYEVEAVTQDEDGTVHLQIGVGNGMSGY